MATLPPKAPPRFVPTLTDVVQIPAGPEPAAAAVVPERGAAPAASPVPVPAPAQAAPLPHPSVGVPGALQPVPPPAAPAPTGPAMAVAPADFSGIEEVVIHRIIQRVDVVLDQRLREAIATVVQEQTRSMVPRLREEVESVVRHAVYEAVAEELATLPGSASR
ncbi:hypothetical protein M4R22_00715 [Acidovorax sp. GBBC 3334]|uniref:hypothetical protein n=1 Tax=Acidovorax sp. GBBC 3334 TaxID=2940496 RepID=UPI0023038B27|nr:hypothetical protein [Acidovorax sp. GBBC 3334]MDA8453272.1 hypothetical protein [Acidovorax sp. GBBC 3334]